MQVEKTSARGLFCATGKNSKPIMVDLIDGEAVYADHLAREKDDFYPTPIEPTRAFLAAEGHRLRGHVVWECAAGDGAMVGELEAFGLDVYKSDLVDRGCGAHIQNFYDFDQAPSPVIVTNPPFDQCGWGNGKVRWQLHALETLGVQYMALLLPIGFAGAGGLKSFWQKHAPARVYLMRWKIDFTGQGSPPMLNAWYVWDGHTDPADTRFLMMDRDDWRQGNLLEVAA